MWKLSVILCTHNPRGDYLERTLASLRAQSLPNEGWELLVIDNASSQPLEDTLKLEWHPAARCVREDEAGLTPARLRGIKEARGELLIFVDDDNVLEADYFVEALAIHERYPALGVFGAGILKPEFEAEPSRAVTALLPLLALRAVANPKWGNDPLHSAILPWGAGLCVRRSVASYYSTLVERLQVSAVLDRREQKLFSGGDDLFSWAAAECGLGFGIFPELCITHLISAGRLQEKYLLKLVHDHSYSHGVLRYLLLGELPKAMSLTRGVHILLHGLRNGRFSMTVHARTARGEAGALRFIRENRLRSIGKCSSPRQTVAAAPHKDLGASLS